MDNFANSTPALAQEDKPHFFNRMLKIIAYPIAAASGIWVAAQDVHTSLVAKAKSIPGNPIFEGIKEKFDPIYQINTDKWKTGTISAKEYLTEGNRIKGLHSKEMGEALEKAGFASREEWFGLKKLGTKWNYISKVHQQEAVIKGMSVTGIAIGALLTIANSRMLIDLFSGKKDQDEKSR